MARLDRPLYCTEWMARPIGSRIDNQLALFKARGIGCFQWGFVRGRTQTHLPWPEGLLVEHGGRPEAEIWFHDLLAANGEPFSRDETRLIRQLAAR